jgi:hypothetical protein
MADAPIRSLPLGARWAIVKPKKKGIKKGRR